MEENVPRLMDAQEHDTRRNEAADAAGEREETPRALLVVPDSTALSTGVAKVRDVLSDVGYDVSWITPADALSGYVLVTPDVILLDGASSSVNTLCRHLKSEYQDKEHGALDGVAPVLVLVPQSVDLVALTRAGADEFLSENSSQIEILARFSTAVRLARLKRELQSTRERLSHQIQVDDLTQVLNRRFFFQAAYRECSRARRYGNALSCLMVEADHFHLYNTTFGYSCGDYLLREVASILKTCVRDTDLVARFGGSKFVVLLTHTDVDGAGTVRQKIEKLVNGKTFTWHHQELPVTVSIGEAERVPGRNQALIGEGDESEEESHPISTREDLAELLEDADSALFVAKKGARYPAFLESNVAVPGNSQ